MKPFLYYLSALLICTTTMVGCGDSTPAIVPASGVVTLNEKPLAGADVRFVPMAPGLDGNFVASGITDENGAFTLTLQGKSESGCCASTCKVLIEEAPLPAEVRAAYVSDDQKVIQRYEKSLKNRPIPEMYSKLKTTPLKIDVSADQTQYDLQLER